MNKQLIVMVGLPGSGKSTKAWDWATKKDITYVSRDVVRAMLGMRYSTQAEDVIKRMIRCLIEASFLRGQSAIVDATHLTEKSRRSLIELAKKYKAEPLAVVMNTSYETCFFRNSNREQPVPKENMRKMAGDFQMPVKEEGFSKIYLYNETRKGEGYLWP